MKDRTKNILIGVLIIGLVSMTVAYAALSQTLVINGSAKVQARATSWNVHFTEEDDTNLNAIVPINYAKLTTQNSTIQFTNSYTTVTTPDVTLRAPGDKVTFYFDVVNEGEINAKIGSISSNVGSNGVLAQTAAANDGGYSIEYADNYTESSATGDVGRLAALKGDIEVKLTYVSGGNALAVNDPLKGTLHTPAGDRRKDLMLTIEYKNTNETQVLPEHEVLISGIQATINYVQDNAD